MHISGTVSADLFCSHYAIGNDMMILVFIYIFQKAKPTIIKEDDAALVSKGSKQTLVLNLDYAVGKGRSYKVLNSQPPLHI